jgi:hypothetical protein
VQGGRGAGERGGGQPQQRCGERTRRTLAWWAVGVVAHSGFGGCG